MKTPVDFCGLTAFSTFGPSVTRSWDKVIPLIRLGCGVKAMNAECLQGSKKKLARRCSTQFMWVHFMSSALQLLDLVLQSWRGKVLHQPLRTNSSAHRLTT
jgi:hypothetical protein